jgi:acetoin utilization deacetylase AcuC-like enzyme
MTGYVYDDLFLSHYASGHPESPERLRAIMEKLEADGILAQIKKIPATEVSEEDLLLVHERQMIERVQKASRNAPTWLDPDTYVAPYSYRAAISAAGGGINLVSEIETGKIRNGMALLRPPGHHATSNRSMGFCLFNNIAIAARYLQKHHKLSKIAIIDWDVHHGNGTQDIFYNDPTVFYMSTHLFPHYPGTGSRQETGEGEGLASTVNLPLDHGVSRDFYMDHFTKGLQNVRNFQPDFILISAGFDSHAQDPLGGLSLVEDDFALMTSQICDIAIKTCSGKVASFLEGGYNLESLAASVVAHIKSLMNYNE